MIFVSERLPFGAQNYMYKSEIIADRRHVVQPSGLKEKLDNWGNLINSLCAHLEARVCSWDRKIHSVFGAAIFPSIDPLVGWVEGWLRWRSFHQRREACHMLRSSARWFGATGGAGCVGQLLSVSSTTTDRTRVSFLD